MKIKQPKYMTEKEALYWLADNLKTDGGLEREGVFYKVEFIDEDNKLCWTTDGRYYIDEEVEITEETKLDLVDIYKDYGLPLEVAFCKNTTVKEILKLDKESKIDTRFIHLQNEDGSIGDLIWSKERGLID